MLLSIRCLYSKRSSTAFSSKTLSPLEIFTQLQLGIHPPMSAQKSFLMEYCRPQLERRLITEAKLIAMESKLCEDMLRSFLYEQYLSVPFRVFTFDMEFTGPPAFTSDGPTQDITEIGIYSPTREVIFHTLVRPCCGRRQSAEVEKLTNIPNSDLDTATVFPEAWNQFMAFAYTPELEELPGSEKRILLLSHGGKLADVSLIKWTVEKFKLPLPSSFVFGDTVHLIRDAHRRRPVTIDKHPPSWGLLDLIQWLKVEPTLPAHRAGNDAKMTWDALYHTLLRYGEEEMTPRQQLIPRFFDEEAKRRMSAEMFKNARQRESDLNVINSIDNVNFDEIGDDDSNMNSEEMHHRANKSVNNTTTNNNNSSNNDDDDDEFSSNSYAVADSPESRPLIQEAKEDGDSAIFDLNFDEIFSNCSSDKPISSELYAKGKGREQQQHEEEEQQCEPNQEEEYLHSLEKEFASTAARAASVLSSALENEPATTITTMAHTHATMKKDMERCEEEEEEEEEEELESEQEEEIYIHDNKRTSHTRSNADTMNIDDVGKSIVEQKHGHHDKLNKADQVGCCNKDEEDSSNNNISINEESTTMEPSAEGYVVEVIKGNEISQPTVKAKRKGNCKRQNVHVSEDIPIATTKQSKSQKRRTAKSFVFNLEPHEPSKKKRE